MVVEEGKNNLRIRKKWEKECVGRECMKLKWDCASRQYVPRHATPAADDG